MSRSSRPPSIYTPVHSDQLSVHSLQMSKSMCSSPQNLDISKFHHYSPQQPRRRSTLRLGTAAVQDVGYGQLSNELTRPNRIQMGTSSCNGQLRKSYSAFSGISMPDSASPEIRRRQAYAEKNRPTIFKNVFGHQMDPRGDHAGQSDYFVPMMKGQVSSSQSEASLWSSSDWTANCDQCRSETTKQPEPVKKIKKSFPSTSSISSLGSSTAATFKRGLAKLSFRGTSSQLAPSSGGVIQRKTKDDMCEQMNSDAVRARRMHMRRGNTDLSAHRLATYQPQISLSGHKDRPLAMNRALTQPLPPPLVPPHGRLNDNAMQKCIDELRRRRTDSSSNNNSIASTTSSVRPPEVQMKPRGGSVFNKKPELNNNNLNRRSVPNIPDQDITFVGSEDYPRNPQAKLGRAPGTNELQTINEGLITPIVRRKQNQRQFVRIPPNNAEPSAPTSTQISSQDSQREINLIRPSEKVKVEESSQTTPTFVHKVQPNTSRNWTAINEELKSRQNIAKVKPQPLKRSLRPKPMETKGSDYAQLNELEDKKELEEDDCVSVAGTVFNEPWDSNAWENLMDIAHHYEEKPDKAKAKAVYLECCTNDPITEEEDNTSLANSISSSSSKQSQANQTIYSSSDVEVQQVPLSIDDEDEALELMSDDQFEQTSINGNVLSISDNNTWREVSKRIPSEPGTFDPRKGKSSSMNNVAEDNCFMSPLLDTRSMKSRMVTPAVFSQSHLNVSMDELSMNHTYLIQNGQSRLRQQNHLPDPGFRIQRYVEQLATNSLTTFGATLQQFIECTIDAGESDPHVVIRNVRQFLNGIKNYLVKHGEADLLTLIEQESAKLNPNEFLNIDAILEAVLHKILLVPIKPHLYHLMCRENIKNGSFETLTANLSKVRTMRPDQLGFPKGTLAPDLKKMEQVRVHLRKMQNHYSPLKKLENLLKALNVVLKPSTNTLGKGSPTKKLPSADEIIRWLVFLLARTSTVSCEVEAWYMWELLPQQLLTTGDAAYYLSTLLSAVHVLKNLDSIHRLKFMSNEPNFSTPQSSLRSCIEEASDAYIRVAIPDEQKGSIEYHTFPAVAQMNVARLCRVIAHQLAITNPEDYGLCVLYDGYETLLHANETPDAIRAQLNETGKPHLFAYKRHDAKIAWPASAVQLTSTSAKFSPTQQSRFV